MSAAEIHDDEDVVEIEAGDEAPFSQLASWVALSGISDHAKALYWHLTMHLNTVRMKDGDREVWPSKETLAAFMGLAKPSGVDRYMNELAEIGAVRVVRRRHGRMRTRNRYVVFSHVPEGWAGPVTLGEFYARRAQTLEGQVTA